MLLVFRSGREIVIMPPGHTLAVLDDWPSLHKPWMPFPLGQFTLLVFPCRGSRGSPRGTTRSESPNCRIRVLVFSIKSRQYFRGIYREGLDWSKELGKDSNKGGREMHFDRFRSGGRRDVMLRSL